MTSAQPVAAIRDASRPGATTRVLVLARVALVPAVACYVVAVVVAGVIAASASGATPGAGPGLDQAVSVGVPLWLATHLVPLRLAGAPLGVLPLLPALGLAVFVAVVARGALRALGGTTGSRTAPSSGPVVTVVATAAASHAVIGVFAAAMLAPETVVDASPGQAGVVAGLLAGCAALAGVARPAGLVDEVVRRVPRWARRGVATGAFASSVLVTAGATLVFASLVAHAPAVVDGITTVAPDPGSGAGLTLLSVLYLPNAVVGAASWVLGPGLSVGLASAAPTAAVVAPLPPIPLLAAMPSGQPPSWAGLVFAVPLAVGSLVGWRLAPTTPDPAARSRALGSVGVASLTAAILLGVAAALAGGRLGSGPFDPVAVPPVLVAGAALGWVLVPGAVMALLAVPSASGPRRPRSAVQRAGQEQGRDARDLHSPDHDPGADGADGDRAEDELDDAYDDGAADEVDDATGEGSDGEPDAVDVTSVTTASTTGTASGDARAD